MDEETTNVRLGVNEAVDYVETISCEEKYGISEKCITDKAQAFYDDLAKIAFTYIEGEQNNYVKMVFVDTLLIMAYEVLINLGAEEISICRRSKDVYTHTKKLLEKQGKLNK